MSIWLALAGIGVATDNLVLAAFVGGTAAAHLLKQWLRTLALALIVELQGVTLGWLVGIMVDKWLGPASHWVAIGFVLGIGVKMVFELRSQGRWMSAVHFSAQSVLDLALGTAMYAFVYGQSMNILHSSLERSLVIMGLAAALCLVLGFLTTARIHSVWIGRLSGAIAVCLAAIVLLTKELGIVP
jgi:putative Mn2+ efflux pump MntP